MIDWKQSDEPESWVLVLRPLPRTTPVPQRVRRLLKVASSLGLQCVSVRDAATDESGELQAVIRGLADRVHKQAELLRKSAEKKEIET